jgi:hypothetical protein
VKLNGQTVPENFVTYQQLMEGGTLEFVLGNKPNTERGTAPETYPFSQSKSEEVSVPYISNDISFFEKEVTVHCGTATEGAEIRYTTDGTEPTKESSLYSGPFVIDHSAIIKLKAFKNGLNPSTVATYEASKATYRNPEQVHPTKNGAAYKYYEGYFSKVNDIQVKGKLVSTGTCDQIGLSVAKIPDHYGLIFSGYVYAPVDGIYTFSTRSDDGSVLKIDGKIIVDNDSSHAEIRAIGRIALKKGFHPYELLYFEDYEGEALSMSWIVPGSEEKTIDSKFLYIK